MTKLGSKIFFLLFFLGTLCSVNALANDVGACHIRVQYGPVAPNDDHIDDMMQTYCYPNLTNNACHQKAQRGNFRGLVLSVHVLAWVKGGRC